MTLLITWVLWWGDAVLVRFTSLQESDILPTVLFTIGGFGPTIAALFCLEEKASVKSIAKFIFGCEKKSILIVSLFIVFELAVIGLSSMELNSEIDVIAIPLILLEAILSMVEMKSWDGVGPCSRFYKRNFLIR